MPKGGGETVELNICRLSSLPSLCDICLLACDVIIFMASFCQKCATCHLNTKLQNLTVVSLASDYVGGFFGDLGNPGGTLAAELPDFWREHSKVELEIPCFL